MKGNRPSISINGEVGRRLAAYCEDNQVSMSSIVECLALDVVDGRRPIPAAAIARGRVGTGPCFDPADLARVIVVPSTAELDQIAAARRALEAAPSPFVALTGTADLWVSGPILEAVQDLVARAAARGRAVDPSDVLDAAINRMIDSMLVVPWCRTCLERHAECGCRARRSA